MVIIETQNRRPKQYTENLSAKLENSNENSEQPGPGATLLGWPKSIYLIILKF